jgi:hypothetical protein
MGMGKDITFEAQVRSDGDWRTVGVFVDRDAALSEAERALASRRTPAARVLQVIFDADKNECTEYTVFRGSAFEEDTGNPTRQRVSNADIFKRNRERPAARTGSGARWMTIAAVALLCLGGLAAILLLR